MKDINALLNKDAQLFLMCCDMRNFSSVAQALGLSRSAVSKAISGMEDDLGFQLFERNTRPLVLTAEARILQQYFRRVTGEFNQVMTQIRNDNFLKPVLRIGMLESLHLSLGTAIIRELYPKISQITIITASANVLMQRLMERKVDLIISNDFAPTSTKLFRKLILEEPSVILLPHSFYHGEARDGVMHPLTWSDLRYCGLPMIQYWKETGAGKVNDLFIRTIGMQFPERIIVDTNQLLVYLVKENLGWALTRPTTVLENIQWLPSIVVAPCPKPVLSRQVYIIGRESEFTLEAEYLGHLCQSMIQTQILPKLLSFAPWMGDSMTAKGKPDQDNP